MSAAPGILYVLPWSIDAIGGVNQVVTNLIQQGARTGQSRPVLLENCPSQKLPRDVSPTRLPALVQFWFRTPFSQPRPWRSTLAFLLKSPGALRHLAALLKRYRVATVNVHYPSLAALHFRLLRSLGLYDGRIVVSFHGLDIRAAASTRGFERLAWHWLLNSADHVVACSQALAREIEAFDPACRDRMTVIHNGVDPDTLLGPMAGSHSPTEIHKLRYVLNVGTFEHKKGQDVLLEAFPSLVAEFPELRLVLVGRTTPFLSELQDRVTQLGLGPQVVICTDIPHERIAPYFANAAVFCLPSRAEPFGIVLLEAALFDVPVVATSVGGITEIVRAGQDGTLVPPDDPAALSAALRSILTDDATARRQAASLKRRVTEHFTWRQAFLKYLKLA